MNDLIEIDIKYDSKLIEKFNELGKRGPELNAMVLDRFGEVIVGDIKENKLSGQVLNVVSGRLKTSIGRKKVNNNTIDVGSILTNLIYAAIHEFGGVILPKNANALHFKVGDGYAIVKKVVMPKRPYVKPAIDEFFNSGRSQRLANITIQDFIDGVFDE